MAEPVTEHLEAELLDARRRQLPHRPGTGVSGTAVSSILDGPAAIQEGLDRGLRPRFLDSTASIRESDWVIAPVPPDLEDRRVEITGPVDARMMINALNSGARVFMADFEDATSPTWPNLLEGQANLVEAYQRHLASRDRAEVLCAG